MILVLSHHQISTPLELLLITAHQDVMCISFSTICPQNHKKPCRNSSCSLRTTCPRSKNTTAVPSKNWPLAFSSIVKKVSRPSQGLDLVTLLLKIPVSPATLTPFILGASLTLSSPPYPPSAPDSFASNLTYTFGNFSNHPHVDNDGGIWTFGIFAAWNLEDNILGRMMKGFDVQEGEFVMRTLGSFTRWEGFDGYIKMAWRSTQDVHFTLPSVTPFPKRFTRWGSTAQINTRYKTICQQIMQVGGRANLGDAQRIKTNPVTNVKQVVAKQPYVIRDFDLMFPSK